MAPWRPTLKQDPWDDLGYFSGTIGTRPNTSPEQRNQQITACGTTCHTVPALVHVLSKGIWLVSSIAPEGLMMPSNGNLQQLDQGNYSTWQSHRQF